MLLAVETATHAGSVAALDLEAGSILEEVDLGAKNHAAMLAPSVRTLVERYGLPRAYAVDIGPGSFTGLRVGLAFVKGLARAVPAPAIPVGALEVLAFDLIAQSSGRGLMLPLLKASGGTVFAGLFTQGYIQPEPDPSLPVGRYSIEVLLARLAEAEAPVTAGGEGSIGFEGLENLPSSLEVLPAPSVPRAGVLGRLARGRLQSGESTVASALEPAYHQLSAAEERYEQAGLNE